MGLFKKKNKIEETFIKVGDALFVKNAKIYNGSELNEAWNIDQKALDFIYEKCRKDYFNKQEFEKRFK